MPNDLDQPLEWPRAQVVSPTGLFSDSIMDLEMRRQLIRQRERELTEMATRDAFTTGIARSTQSIPSLTTGNDISLTEDSSQEVLRASPGTDFFSRAAHVLDDNEEYERILEEVEEALDNIGTEDKDALVERILDIIYGD